MKTGFRGTFIISWSQTEVDGLGAAPVQSLDVGATWSWHGETVQVDGPDGVLRLEMSESDANMRKGAARMVRRLVGVARGQEEPVVEADDGAFRDCSFVVTDGAESYTVSVIEVGGGAAPLLMFLNSIPPRDRDLWVVHHTLEARRQRARATQPGQGVICFTPGTMIATPEGPRAVETLREGDRVSTLDSGAQEVLWIGSRRMSGARLFAMPTLRPIRIRGAAFGPHKPRGDLLVSPEHRLLLRGDVARDLFNTPEVLVSARDLVNGRSVVHDATLREVTYIHLLMPSHQVLWANGIQTESFHPASADLDSLDAGDRSRLLRDFPDLDYDPHSYGDYARRNLSTSEAAILLHEAA